MAERKKNKIKEVRTFVYPNAIVRVHIPELTEEERNRRMEEIKKATVRLWLAYEKAKKKREEMNTGESKERQQKQGGGDAGQ